MPRTWPWLIAIAVGASMAAAPQGPIDPPAVVDVYRAGDAGYHTFRIPSVIAAKDGTLLAFAEGRRAGTADAGDIDLVLKRSRDEGRTWSALQVVGDDGPNTVGNPCPVLDRTTGTIWLLTTRNRGTDREGDIIAGTSAGTRTVWVMRTADAGRTWSAPREITASVKQPDWTWYATGPGVGIQTRSGRLVIPANHAEPPAKPGAEPPATPGAEPRAKPGAAPGAAPGAERAAEPGAGVHRSHVFYSDDHGAHWTLGASADPGTNESQVVELSDGRLLLNMRNHPPKAENFRMVATSADGGRTLTPARPDPALIEPPAQASLIALAPARAAGARPRLVFANPASTRRERLTVRISEDGGESWPIARLVHEGPAAYSSLVALRQGSIGLLFERGDRSPYERISYARLTPSWLSAGTPWP